MKYILFVFLFLRGLQGLFYIMPLNELLPKLTRTALYKKAAQLYVLGDLFRPFSEMTWDTVYLPTKMCITFHLPCCKRNLNVTQKTSFQALQDISI